MPKKTNQFLQEARNRPLAYIVQVVGIVVVLANIWIASKLAPIAQDLLIVTKQVEANAEEISELVPRTELSAEFDDIVDRLNRIESKLDRHLELDR